MEGKQLVGIITSRDTRLEVDTRQSVLSLMTPKERLITVHEDATRDEVFDIFRRHRVEKILIVNKNFELRGMYTVRDLLKSKSNPYACKTQSGQLRVAAAVGTGEAARERISALAQEGVDAIVVDTAHGHSKGVIEQVKWIKQHYPDMQVIAGNIATGDAAIALADAGVDGVVCHGRIHQAGEYPDTGARFKHGATLEPK